MKGIWSMFAIFPVWSLSEFINGIPAASNKDRALIVK